MKAILAIAVICVGGVLSLSEVNEDNLRDQYMYGAGARARRAVCGTKPTITPWRPDPSCYNCVRAGCFVISKRVSIPGRICPRKCCFTSILRGGTSASKSFDSASVKKMASSIVAAFGKRADVSKFKKPSVDLVFLIDDSGSIPAPQFKIAKEGAATLSQTFCPKRFGTVKGTKQVAAVLFSTTAKTIMTFQDSRKGEGYVEETIMNMQQRSGATATADALKHVREKVLGQAGSRLNDPDTATIVFVITDGKCNDDAGGVLSVSVLNEDIMRDQLMYDSGARSKRAVCGSQANNPSTTPRMQWNTAIMRTYIPSTTSRMQWNTPGTYNPWNRLFTTQRPLQCQNCDMRKCFPTSKKRALIDTLRQISNPLCSSSCCGWNGMISRARPRTGGTLAPLFGRFGTSGLKKMASSIVSSIGKREAANKFKKPSMDLIFLIDDSGSIPPPQFKIAKEGAATLSQVLCPKTFGTVKGTKQVSAVLFSTTPKTIMTFEQSRQGAGYVEETIMNAQQRSEGTATTDGLKHIREKVLGKAGSRLNDPDTSTVVFVITDGKCNDGCSQLKAEAKRLRETGPGVQVYAFGIGEADCHELELIRSSESGQVFGLPDFNFFEKLANAIKDEVASNPNACQ